MKRWVFGLSLFWAAFSAGVAVVRETVESRPVNHENQPQAAAPEMTSILPPGLSEEFVPEFANISVPDDESSNADLEYGDLGGCVKDETFQRSWLAFFRRGDRYSLERRDVHFGDREVDSLGGYYEMQFKDKGESLFLLSDTGKLRAGPVKTLFLANDSGPYGDRRPAQYRNPDFRSEIFLEEGGKQYHQAFEFEESKYSIRTAPATTNEGHRVTALIVEGGATRQPVYYADVDRRHLGDINWIGDMDGDSRMDFQFTFYAVNGGGSRSILFLSSLAKQDELVRPYAFYSARRHIECQ